LLVWTVGGRPARESDLALRMSFADKITSTLAAVGNGAHIVNDRAAPALGWLREYAPIVGRSAVRRRNRIVLAPYARIHSLRRTISNIALAPGLALLCLAYGFFFGLTAPTLIVAFVAPIALLAALIIWALPGQRAAPTIWIEFLFPAFFVALIIWPNYLAISLPGLPWITMLRVLALPMTGCLLVSLSVSASFRKRVAESVTGVKLVWILFCAFNVLQVLTIFLSRQPGASAQLVFNQQIYWTVIFVIACALFRDVRYVEKYWALLCAIAVPIMIVTALESREQHILWVDHIPPILRIPDPSVGLTLAPSFRPGINLYRAKATFSTQLQLAEYLALLTPFLLHFGFFARKQVFKIAAFAMIPLVFITIRMTDARLGVAGMIVSLLLYGLLWSVVRWRSHPRDLLAAAVVYAYPAVFLAGVASVFASYRIHAMVFGDGAQASSSAARDNQLAMALGRLIQAPWGHGTGQSGLAMGYADGAFITIDNYFITVGLDYGVLGVFLWSGIFISGIVAATYCCLSAKYAGRQETRLLAPLAVALSAFMVMKWVHGQDYTHPVPFMLLGMVSALVYRLRHPALAAFPSVVASPRPPGQIQPRAKPAPAYVAKGPRSC
jgi:hypothetical protein